jgi:hypothetical protein
VPDKDKGTLMFFECCQISACPGERVAFALKPKDLTRGFSDGTVISCSDPISHLFQMSGQPTGLPSQSRDGFAAKSDLYVAPRWLWNSLYDNFSREYISTFLCSSCNRGSIILPFFSLQVFFAMSHCGQAAGQDLQEYPCRKRRTPSF